MRRMVTDKQIEEVVKSMPSPVIVFVSEEGATEPDGEFDGQLEVCLDSEGFIGLYVWADEQWVIIYEA